MPTSPRGLEATGPRLPTRYRRPRRAPRRPQRRLFVVVSVLTALVLLLGTFFIVAPTPTPTPPAVAEDALRQRRLPLLAFAGPALIQASDVGITASTDGGAAWTALQSPEEAALTALVVSPSDASVRYAAGLSLGVVRSVDSGTTWQAVLPGSPTLPDAGSLPLTGHLVTALAIDPSNSQNVFAWSAGRGLLASSDGGTTWQFAGAAAGNTSIISLLFVSGEPASIWAGGSQGLLRSQDGGQSFASLPESGVVGEVTALAQGGDGALFVANTRGELWRSDDDGASWSNPGDIAVRSSITSLVADPAAAGRLWAASADGRLWRSDDGGASWSALRS